MEERNDQFTQLFQAAPIPYLLLDTGGTIVLANDPAQQLLALPGQALRSTGDIIGTSLFDFIQPEDFSLIEKHLRQVHDQGKNRIEEILIRSDRNNPKWCSIESSLQPQNPHWIFMILYDITPKKTLEDDLILAQNQAVQANRLKNLFLANLSHELRGALTSILHLATAADPEAASKPQGALPTLKATAQGTLRLIDDILDFTAVEDGRLSVRNNPFVFQQLIEHLRQRFLPQARKKNLELHCRSSIKDDLLIDTDQDRLGQIISNLLENAIAYTETGRIDLIASYRPLTDFMGEIDIEVRDSGKGISQDILRDIWQGPGFDSNRFQKNTHGPGLGLPLCKRLSKLLGGQIYLNSNPGFGTSVYINLPVHVRQEENPTSTGTVQISPSTSLTSPLPVLVVEDDDLNRVVLTNILKSLGYMNISTARDGYEALSVLKQLGTIQLVFMDISMPGMDGLQATRCIRAGEAGDPNVPVIAVSAHSLKGDNETFIKSGMNYSITKPYTRIQIQDAIASVLKSGTEPHGY